MNDEDILNGAARAAGLQVKGTSVDIDEAFQGLLTGKRNTREREVWNPLKDDSDAFRLMVKLGLIPTLTDTSAVVYDKYRSVVTVQNYADHPNKTAAVRRAMTVTAYKIWKANKRVEGSADE